MRSIKGDGEYFSVRYTPSAERQSQLRRGDNNSKSLRSILTKGGRTPTKSPSTRLDPRELDFKSLSADRGETKLTSKKGENSFSEDLIRDVK
jgi:hypothetical protein